MKPTVVQTVATRFSSAAFWAGSRRSQSGKMVLKMGEKGCPSRPPPSLSLLEASRWLFLLADGTRSGRPPTIALPWADLAGDADGATNAPSTPDMDRAAAIRTTDAEADDIIDLDRLDPALCCCCCCCAVMARLSNFLELKLNCVSSRNSRDSRLIRSINRSVPHWPNPPTNNSSLCNRYQWIKWQKVVLFNNQTCGLPSAVCRSIVQRRVGVF